MDSCYYLINFSTAENTDPHLDQKIYKVAKFLNFDDPHDIVNYIIDNKHYLTQTIYFMTLNAMFVDSDNLLENEFPVFQQLIQQRNNFYQLSVSEQSDQIGEFYEFGWRANNTYSDCFALINGSTDVAFQIFETLGKIEDCLDFVFDKKCTN